MFSMWEMVVILCVAVIVIGPEQIPKISYRVGKLIHKFQTLSQDINQKIEEQTKLAELEKNQQRAELSDKHYQ